jgi:hypothetical protein
MINKYGLEWPANDPLDVEFEMIRRGGRFELKGKQYGLGLPHHYAEATKLLWPEDDWHTWAELLSRRLAEEDITVIIGPADSSKTYSVSKHVMVDWWAQPDTTLWLLSSTELRGAELRIWGAMKQLFNRARAIRPWLIGTVLESLHAISTETIAEKGSEGRLLTKGLIFIPCKTGGQWVGLGAYAGIKPVRVGDKEGRLGHVGDEASLMGEGFLDAYSNWYGKENFHGILTGNWCDFDDPLGKAAEPVNGWDTWEDTGKTQEWRSRFYNALVVDLDGRDSPNAGFPFTPYKYLVGPKKLAAVKATHGEDSWQYWSQCVGKPRALGNVKRVLTKSLCEANGAFEQAVWAGGEIVKVGFLDAAYGGVGGDRCVCGYLEFGPDVDGRQVIAIHPLVQVPVSVRNIDSPEDQIARFCMRYFMGVDVPPEHFFFDGRSTLAVALSRLWSTSVNVIDFGGPATDRPVSQDEFVWDGEEKTRRLKRCDEHYSKFVTELWFTLYYLVISKQLRQLPKDAAAEAYKREWRYTKGNRIEVETKKEMKKRTNYSPDLIDSIVTGVEGARRLGFQIELLRGDISQAAQNKPDWLEAELKKHKQWLRQTELTYD